MPAKAVMAFLLILITGFSPLFASEIEDKQEEGAIFTLWPLVDYRKSPREGYTNLSILGPIFKLQFHDKERDLAVRPLFYNSSNSSEGISKTTYLYPLASSQTSPDAETTQVLKLYQKNVFRKGEEGEQKDGMLFPFYIQGTSQKYGPYLSVFPFYGDLYERFWRDEYHYVLFPLYSRTVKKGTTTRNYLYPVFSTIEGDKESGFQVWPLYGQSAKEGVYRKRFVIWPIFFDEEVDLDTDNPTRKLFILPLYASVESPNLSSRHYLWPFFGHSVNRAKKSEEWDYFWPFFVTVKGENRTLDRYIPFYSADKRKDYTKHWYMWPLYSHEKLETESFGQERSRILYFLYSDNRETWNVDGKSRRKVAFWPLFLYKKDVREVKSFSFPAPVEPIVDGEGIERHWAPLWRIYIQKWTDEGSAASFLWNLYWHEHRKGDLALEFFPVVSYRTEKQVTDFKLFKGLIRFQKRNGEKKLSFFWLPFGLGWGKPVKENIESGQMEPRSKQ
ncbi:MAG: hypothetical protein H6Q57_2043 [Geobacteraceae bacterium]|jgi:hypothetical protein|nr:hypothetical protein [Geobacteraceae bacterium]